MTVIVASRSGQARHHVGASSLLAQKLCQATAKVLDGTLGRGVGQKLGLIDTNRNLAACAALPDAAAERLSRR